MAENAETRKIHSLPEGFNALPIHDTADAPLRICVLTRRVPDPATGHFVLLRDLHDARVYLGCVTDAGGGVREWIEVWVQNVDGLEASLPAFRETFSNLSLDQRWSTESESLRTLNPDGFIQTGWETEHPLPTFLDPAGQGPAFPGQPEGPGKWELCQEDPLLQSKGLPPYRTSLFRYLYQAGAGPEARFVPVTEGCPQSAATARLTEAMPEVDGLVPFNPQAGLIRLISFAPIPFEDYADLLGGAPWKGIELGKKHLKLGGVYGQLQEAEQVQQTGAYLFMGLHGRPGRVVETYHLKVQLLLELFRLVQSFVEREQLPLLNLGADSFRVRLSQPGSGLPYLWTATCALVKPSQAFALPIESGEFRYFIRARAGGASIYLPEGISGAWQSSGSVRIRKVHPPEDGRVVLEGTLVTQEKLSASPHDLLWMRLPLPSGRVDLYGHLYALESLAQGEARFRTIPQQLPAGVAKTLTEAEGVSFARSPYEIVPLLSTPCDLYSLGVLAVRTLLVDEKTTLAIALDEVLSLARQVANEYRPDSPLAGRIREIFERDERYVASLGSPRLTRQEMAAGEAWLPAELWFDTLAAVVRLFPGLGPDSICKDYGDAPALALETVFSQPIEELGKLLLRSRSLILIDWKFNREVSSVIKKFQARQPRTEG